MRLAHQATRGGRAGLDPAATVLASGIPAGIEHGFRVGDVPSRKLNLYSPAAMVGYFDELSAAIRSGDADPERLEAIARRFGMEVTGPVPRGYL